MHPIDRAIRNFQKFLNDSFPTVEFASDAVLSRERCFKDEFFEDWAQANWELLVERVVCENGQFLEVYASGSDYERARHSRVFFREKMPSHSVFCKAKTGDKVINLIDMKTINPEFFEFEKLVCFSGEEFDDLPPFDHVLMRVEDQEEIVLVRCLEVNFDIREIKEV